MMQNIKNLLNERQFRRAQELHRLAAGRLTAAEAAAQLNQAGDIPLCMVQPEKGDAVALSTSAQPRGSHLLVVAPPTEQVTYYLDHVLLKWPYAAVVVDSNGKLHKVTAAFRERLVGRVYTFPGNQIDLGRYFPFWDESQAQKLHYFLMSPYAHENQEQIKRSIALYLAVGHYAHARSRNLMQLLLDVASCGMLQTLRGLETVPEARLYVRQFCKGQSPHEAIHDPDTVTAFNLFTQQMQRYQPHYSLFATAPATALLPAKWAQDKASVYLTYDSLLLKEIGGLVVAIVNGLVRSHQSSGQYSKLLLVLNETIAQQIPNFDLMLSSVSDYGITVLLVASSWQGLDNVLGKTTRHLFQHLFGSQIWYPPRDEETAQKMSAQLGYQLQRDAQDRVPVMTAAEIAAWPSDRVLVKLWRDRAYCIIGEAMAANPAIGFRYAPPLPPLTAPAPRQCLDWLPSLPDIQPSTTVTQQPSMLPTAVKVIEAPRHEVSSAAEKKKGWR
jgi:hypothetical protein